MALQAGFRIRTSGLSPKNDECCKQERLERNQHENDWKRIFPFEH